MLDGYGAERTLSQNATSQQDELCNKTSQQDELCSKTSFAAGRGRAATSFAARRSLQQDDEVAAKLRSETNFAARGAS